MKSITKILLTPWLAVLTLAGLLSLRVLDPTFIESMRLRYFDTLITSQPATHNNIYTVNIDENTIDRYGQWPFDRRIYAKLIEDIYSRNAGLVVFNILMSETDRQGGDSALAKTLEKNPTVLVALPADRDKNEPHPPGSAVIAPQFQDRIVVYPGLMSNIPMLDREALGVGTINSLPEIDGVNRRVPLIASIHDKLYPSVALEALRAAAGDTTFQVKLNEYGVEKMRIPQFGAIPTDSFGRVWIDWSQQSQSVSALDLPKDFNGAIVVVGVSAAGISNPVSTALGSVWPQDVQAAVIATMIQGTNIQRPDWSDGAEILAILLFGSILIVVAAGRRA